MTYQPAAELTIATARGALAAGMQAIDGGQQVFDFSGVAAIDSAAVAILLAWQRAARGKALTLSFINVPSKLQSLAELYGVAGLLPGQHDVSGFVAPSRTDLPHH